MIYNQVLENMDLIQYIKDFIIPNYKIKYDLCISELRWRLGRWEQGYKEYNQIETDLDILPLGELYMLDIFDTYMDEQLVGLHYNHIYMMTEIKCVVPYSSEYGYMNSNRLMSIVKDLIKLYNP